MGYKVDVYMHDWSALVDAIVDGGGHNREVVEGILHMYGEKICDKYVLVADESMGDADPMCAICAALTSVFEIDEPDELLFGVEYEYIKGYSGSYEEEEDELRKFIEIVEGDKHEK